MTSEITRVRDLIRQRDEIDKQLAQYKELVALLRPKQQRRKKKTDQPTMKMGV